MKIILTAVLLTLLVGCGTRQSSQMPAPIKQATQRYDAIKPTMNRAEVYQSLGQPQKTGADGVEQWRTSEGAQVATLAIRFGPDGKIVSRDFHIDDAGQFTVKP